MISNVHVVPDIHQVAAGPSYTVPRLCQSLMEQGTEVSLYCTLGTSAGWAFPIHSFSRWPFPQRLGVSPKLSHALHDVAGRTDIIHNHSLWMMPNIYPANAVKNTRCKLITAPRGTLSPWAWNRSRWVKKVIWPFQKATLFNADCLHATAESEYQNIRNLGLKAPVAVIRNGVDMPEMDSEIFKGKSSSEKQLLFLGRVHPTKGVDLLLKAWQRLEKEFPDWQLRIVGPDNGGYLKTMEQLRDELQLHRVVFSGPLYGVDKIKAYQSADLYVLPTHTENFGITVAEALVNGIPAIVTKGAPWQDLETHACGWWIERNEQTLYETLYDAMLLPRLELEAMGKRGRAWMQRDFSWDEIGRKMYLTYEWMLGGGDSPEWVRIS